ncbi:MAG: Nif3-like dinuclear metal center hexameric protein [Candidatus Sumerlaeia bacterium]|nr:Nif3-like dinuclear metal center hexameric protein [Candidatus Sumerlaeia bacterium]
MSETPLALSELLGAINRIAPPTLAESWDNVGLQVGTPSDPVRRVLVALEISDAVLDEAESLGIDCIVTHHPLIFSPLKSLNGSHAQGRFLIRLIRMGSALLCAHTNLDSVPEGTNGVLADLSGLKDRKPLFPVPIPGMEEVKYAVYVPVEHVAAVIEAIHQAGAGVIGNYSHCTFRVPGVGTYKPMEGANPFAGEVGKFEEATGEVKLEAICPKRQLEKLLEKVRKVHPYEEIAYDVFPIVPTREPETGLGIVGKLNSSVPFELFVQNFLGVLSQTFPKVSPVVSLVGNAEKLIQRVAVCSGAGGEVVRRWRQGMADVLITGELTHHQAAELRDRGVAALCIGHYASEAIVCGRLRDLLVSELGKKSPEVFVSDVNADPFRSHG